MKLIIIILLSFCTKTLLAGDTSVLVKVKYYGTRVPLNLSPHRIPLRYHVGDFLSGRKCDSLGDTEKLQTVDSMLRNSKAFNKAFTDTIPPFYFDNIEVKRVIVFIYNNKKIYLSDNGSWSYDFRLLRYLFDFSKERNNLFKQRTIKNKLIYLNGPKYKNDKHLRKAIKKVQMYLNCGWC